MSFKCFIKQINCSKIKSPAHSGQQSSWAVGKRKCANVKTFGSTDWSVLTGNLICPKMIFWNVKKIVLCLLNCHQKWDFISFCAKLGSSAFVNFLEKCFVFLNKFQNGHQDKDFIYGQRYKELFFYSLFSCVARFLHKKDFFKFQSINSHFKNTYLHRYVKKNYCNVDSLCALDTTNLNT
jgi:hypothetical protein